MKNVAYSLNVIVWRSDLWAYLDFLKAYSQ
jgi:hypothetical protein